MNELTKTTNDYSRKAEIALAKKPESWHGLAGCNTINDAIRYANENGLGVAACVQFWARLSGASTKEASEYKNQVCKSYAEQYKDNFIAEIGGLLNSGWLVDKKTENNAGDLVKVEIRKIKEKKAGRPSKLEIDAIKSQAQNELIEKLLAAGVITSDQAFEMTR